MSQPPIDMDDVYNEGDETVEEGRGAFVEGDRRNSKPGVKALILLCGVTILGFAALFIYNVASRVSGTAADAVETVSQQASSATAPLRGNSSLEPLDRGTQTEEEYLAAQQRRAAMQQRNAPAQQTPDAPLGQPAYAPPSGTTSVDRRTSRGDTASDEPTPEELLLERRLAGSIVAETESQGGDAYSLQTAGMGGMNNPMLDGGVMSLGGGGSDGSASNNELGGRLNPSTTQPSRASMLQNPSFLLAKGQSIPCGTVSELDTTVPGMVSCQVSRNIYSVNRRVVLIDQGSFVTGSVQGGLSQGQARVFALWEEIRTPHNVRVPLNSPGTNRLGSSGIPGQVDTHFWERFGGAIMFSILSDAGTALVESANNGSDIQLSSTASSSQALAQETLRNSINIPPTLYVSHGENVSIFVARDIDFSDVYGLESANGVR